MERLEECEGVSWVDIWGRVFQVEGTASEKALRQKCSWHCLRNMRRQCGWSGVSAGQTRSRGLAGL